MPPTAKPRHSSSLRARTRRDGVTVWDIRYRRGDGSSTSRTFLDEDAAVQWQDLLSRLGPFEAELALEDVGTNAIVVDGKVSAAAGLTLIEYSVHFFASQSTANDDTVEGYRRFLRNGLAPLAHRPIGSVTNQEVVDWVKMRREIVAEKTVKNEHAFLSALLGRAVEERIVSINVAKGVKIREGLQREMTFLTPAEFKQLLDVFPERWKHVPLLLAGTGLRWSELTALPVRNVDLQRRQLRVTQAWKYRKPNKELGQKGLWYIGPPKTKKARREVALTDQLVDVLRPLMDGKKPDNMIITAVRGGRLMQQKFHESVWAPTVRLINGHNAYPPIEPGEKVKYSREKELANAKPLTTPIGKFPRAHDLRHSHASWLLEQGISLHVLQYRLGHESITTTVDRYGHLSPSSQHEARAATEKAMANLFD